MNVIANLRRYRWNRYRCYVFVGRQQIVADLPVREHPARVLLGQFRTLTECQTPCHSRARCRAALTNACLAAEPAYGSNVVRCVRYAEPTQQPETTMAFILLPSLEPYTEECL